MKNDTLVFQILGGIVLSLSLFVTAPAPAAETQTQGTQGYRDDVYRQPELHKGPPRSGADIYAFRCAGCHAKTTQGAPMPSDAFEWRRRARQGMEVLMEHTINGYLNGLMPPRGGCENCTDVELKSAVLFILQQSGIEPPS